MYGARTMRVSSYPTMRASPRQRLIVSALVVLLASACALTRRFDPPALMLPETVEASVALARYPPGAELVEFASESGAVLRGVFVPADPGSPVVLHLLDARNSVASEVASPSGVAGELADLGLASLLVDYTGVGLSGGERSVRNLCADARAAWREAVARAGGEPERVLVRAVSIGTIAAALLLETGARPRAQVWIVPVFPDTASPRFARAARGPLVAWIARAFLRPMADVRIEESVRSAGVPTTVIVAEQDELTTAPERARLERAALETDGTFHALTGGHIEVAARSRWILPPELALYRELGRPATEERLARTLRELPGEIAALFPEGSRERERLRSLAAVQCVTPAEDLAAAALSEGEPLALARFLWSVRRRPYPALTFEERVDALSLADPAGLIPIDVLEELCLAPDLASQFGQFYLVEGHASVARRARGESGFSCVFRPALGPGFDVQIEARPQAAFDELLHRVTDPAAARRQFARLALKAYRVPDRARPGPDGAWIVEALDEGVWHVLELEPAEIVEDGEHAHEADLAAPAVISPN